MLSTLEIPDRLLVTAPNAGGIALVSLDRVSVLARDDSTGLAIAGARLAWCLQSDGGSRVVEFRDRRFHTIVLGQDDLDLHDLAIDGDGYFAVATGANAVLEIGPNGERKRRVFASAPDSWHINSLCKHDGRWLASAFGRFDETRGYKGRTALAGEVFDVATGTVVASGLSQPHSLTSHGNELWLCNSEAGEVLATRDGIVQRRFSLQGYTRGLAFGDDRLYVGLSCSRNESADIVGERFQTAVIAVVRVSDGRVLGYIPLPWREIYDIRVLDDAGIAESLLAHAIPAQAPVQAEPPLDTTAVTAVHEAVASSHAALLIAISDDIRRMQETTAQAVSESAANRTQAALAAELAPRLLALQQRIEQMDQHQQASLSMQSDRIALLQDRVIQVLSDDIARMQQTTASALAQAAALQAQVDVARPLSARFDALDRALDGTIIELQRQLAAADAGRSRAERALHGLDERVARADAALAAAAAATPRLEARLAEVAAEKLRLQHEAERGREAAQTLERVMGSRSWRWTRPVRALLRALRGEWGRSDSSVMAQMLRGAIVRTPGLSEHAKSSLIERTLPLGDAVLNPARLPDESMTASIHLEPQIAGRQDVFVWSVIDWHFRTQRPQHLARALAERGHRVFYVSNNFSDSAVPGFRVDPLDRSGRLFQVHLNLSGAPPIYFGLPCPAQDAALRRSLGRLLQWTHTVSSLSLVQHPYWSGLMRAVPNASVAYDCMDHHAGFENNASAVLDAERRLIADADVVIVTSGWLEHEIAPIARKTSLVRNAGEYDFFRVRPHAVFADEQGRRIIGYFGAIAEWFDRDLIRRVATDHPDALVVLVGNDTVGAAADLADLANVRLIGEVPYAELPYWLHGFDVALLPFKVIALTLATNPVKVYEYLAAAKPVVAVDLPEMAQFQGLVRVAADHDAFVAAVGQALSTPDSDADRTRRAAFAAGQTWAHRATAIDDAIAGIDEPTVSVVVLTYNNLAYTEACLFSIEAYSDYRNLEVIVVDNASSDGSPAWLKTWAAETSAAGHTRRLVLSEVNTGFAAGNNIGLAMATGDVLVMLNNDTYVTPGWVRSLCAHLRRDPLLGLVGPVTNNIGNEAKLDIHYTDMVDMIAQAGRHTRSRPGASFPLPTVAFFCVAMPRALYAQIGGLDEAFGIGFFEDDDYCRRAALAGWHVACAEDVFIHHHLSASFNQLAAGKKNALFEANKAIYEKKWGPWQPHAYRNPTSQEH